MHVLTVPNTYLHDTLGPTHTVITGLWLLMPYYKAMATQTQTDTLRPSHSGGSGSDTHGHTRPQGPAGHSLLLAAQLLFLVHQVLLE